MIDAEFESLHKPKASVNESLNLDVALLLARSVKGVSD